MSYDLTAAVPGLNSMLINSGTQTFTPLASIQGPYNDMGASGGPGGNTAYLGKYMQGYTAITVPGVAERTLEYLFSHNNVLTLFHLLTSLVRIRP